MEYARILRVTLCLLFSAPVYSNLTTKLYNQAVLVEDSVEFRCAGTGADGMQWRRITVADRYGDSWSSISSGGNVYNSWRDFYTVTDNNAPNAPAGQYDETLRLLNATDEDGVIHECALINGDSAKAQLIVLESSPVCTSNVSGSSGAPPEYVEFEYVAFTCSVNFYTELWAPQMTWKWSGSGTPIASTNATSTTTAEYSVTVQMLAEHNGWTIKCESFFSVPPQGSYPTTWDMSYRAPLFPAPREYETSAFTVLYLREPIIGNAQISYIPGDTITCSALGIPYPTIKWLDLSTGQDVASGQSTASFTVDESMEGGQEYQCQASSAISAEMHTLTTNITFTVTIPTTTPEPPPITGAPVESCASVSDACCDHSDRCDLCKLSTGALSCVEKGTYGTCDNQCSGGWGAGEIAGLVIGLLLLIILIILLVYFCCCRKKAPTKGAGGQVVYYDDGKKNSQEMSGKSPKDPKSKPRMDGVDTIRKPDVAYIHEVPPPYSPYMQPQGRNNEGLMYANLALDDTPRSRKPIQVYEPTEYNDIQRV